jgi:hypothetical protein
MYIENSLKIPKEYFLKHPPEPSPVTFHDSEALGMRKDGNARFHHHHAHEGA